MPLFVPILLGAGAAALTAYGGRKGYDGVESIREAKRKTKKAQAHHERHLRVLDSARENLSKRIHALHSTREETALTTFGRMVKILDALERRGHVKSLGDVEAQIASPEEVRAFAGQLVNAAELLKGGTVATGAGTAASAAATGLVSSLATASTGTAISGLSGAAANSAMLAWLGGGALAAGGWGMAAGTVVLGGITVGPAVLVSGVVLAAQGAKAQEQATRFAADVEVAVSKIDSLVSLLRRGERRVEELMEVTHALAARAHAAMERIEAILQGFDDDNQEHIESLRSGLLLCGALRQVIECRILDDDGQLNATAADLIDRFRWPATKEPHE